LKVSPKSDDADRVTFSDLHLNIFDQAAQAGAVGRWAFWSHGWRLFLRLSFQHGESGLFKFGNSPAEKNVVSPQSASAYDDLITPFPKAKATDQTAAMVSVYYVP
jgi:hypothetical protein